ncbi:MAG: hypothetical protein FJZ01_24235, partial [Candidatus Sericytochromatia bacterium]|nr:hypothetical protein [Candidatus Tanganyikabacteria bacterium]
MDKVGGANEHRALAHELAREAKAVSAARQTPGPAEGTKPASGAPAPRPAADVSGLADLASAMSQAASALGQLGASLGV